MHGVKVGHFYSGEFDAWCESGTFTLVSLAHVVKVGHLVGSD